MKSDVLLIFEKYKLNTDAVETNRGFLYQYLKTLKVWLEVSLNNEETNIFCELEDDIKKINTHNNTVSFTQIKCYSSNLGKNDPEIKKSIYNFFILSVIYQDYDGFFHFETNTNVREHDDLLREWISNQNSMNEKLINRCVKDIQQKLTDIVKEKKENAITKIKKSIAKSKDKLLLQQYEQQITNINSEYETILNTISDYDSVKKFVTKIRWTFEGISSMQGIISTKQLCLSLIQQYAKKESKILLDRLLSEIYFKSSNEDPEQRVLNKNVLDLILKETENELISNSNRLIISTMDELNLQMTGIQTTLEKLSDKLLSDYDFNKILDSYKVKVKSYIDKSIKSEFNSPINLNIVRETMVIKFFEEESWKSKIISSLKELIRLNNSTKYLNIEEINNSLKHINSMNYNYDQFKQAIRELLDTVRNNLGDNNLEKKLNAIDKLTKDKYNKVIIITGEAGEGKTHLLHSIVSSYVINDEINTYLIRIPIDSANIIDYGFDKAILDELNNYLSTKFINIDEANEYFAQIEEDGIRFELTFVIDDLQRSFIASPKLFEYFKKFVEEYTKFDWIKWCVSINIFEQYLLLDKSNFLKEYCYSQIKYDSILEVFFNMRDINEENDVCNTILSNGSIQMPLPKSFSSLYSQNLLSTNPLACKVYLETVNPTDREYRNICYFEFIQFYSELKNKKMIDFSSRDISYQDKEVMIQKDLDKVIDTLIKEKKLAFKEEEIQSLINSNSDLFNELRLTQLIRKDLVEENGLLSRRKYWSICFVFKLYWAFKILLHYEQNNKIEHLSLLKESFGDLKDEIYIYQILYLDMSIEKNYTLLDNQITKDINENIYILMYVATKASNEFQKKLLDKLLNMEKLELDKRETYILMYFLEHSKINLELKFRLIGKYLESIINHDLQVYLINICNKEFNGIKIIKKLKNILVQFLNLRDNLLMVEIGKIAAKNFYRIINNLSINDILDRHLFDFLKINHGFLKKDDKEFTFIDYFIRYLFSNLIDNNKNRFELHEVLLEKDYYFMSEFENLYSDIAFRIRRNSTIAYGSYYKLLKGNTNKQFSDLYLKYVRNLIETNQYNHRLLAYHFLTNTLKNPKDSTQLLDVKFIPILEELYQDKRLESFINQRINFFQTNLEI